MKKQLSKAQQELDRTRITISFGLLSFFMVVLFYSADENLTFTVFGSLDLASRALFGYAVLHFFLFIVCTAAHYKSSNKGLVDGISISPKAAEYHFDSAVDWSFIGISISLVGIVIRFFYPLAKWSTGRCGEHWLLIAVCTSGVLSVLLIIGITALRFWNKSFDWHKNR